MSKTIKIVTTLLVMLLVAFTSSTIGYAASSSSSESKSDTEISETESSRTDSSSSESTKDSNTEESTSSDSSDDYADFSEEAERIAVLASKEPIYSIVIHNLEIPEGKTIKQEENHDGSTTGNVITDSEGNSLKGIAGITFILQRIDLVEGKVPIGTSPETFKISTGENAYTKETVSDANGIARFDDLYAGYYLVIANQSELVTNAMEDTVIEVPQTNITGDGLIDEINIYPKSSLVKEKVELPETSPGTSTKTTPIPQTDAEVSELNNVTLMIGIMFIVVAIACFVLNKRGKKE